jgi:hypothetical protein
MKITPTLPERSFWLEVTEAEADDILYALRKTVPRTVSGRPRNLPVRAMRDKLSALLEKKL